MVKSGSLAQQPKASVVPEALVAEDSSGEESSCLEEEDEESNQWDNEDYDEGSEEYRDESDDGEDEELLEERKDPAELFTALKHYEAVKNAVTNGRGALLGFDDRARTLYKEENGVESNDENDDGDDEDEEEESDNENENENEEKVEEEEEYEEEEKDEGKEEDEKVDFHSIIPVLQQLVQITPFAIGGRQDLGETKFEVYMRNGKHKKDKSAVNRSEITKDKRFDLIGDLKSLDIESVLKYCVVSPFGDLATQETRVDPSVRLAMECKAENIVIIVKNKHGHLQGPFEEPIAAVVKESLLPEGAYRSVTLELNKLNIYSENGHFKPHTDTPTHDPSRFLGSVVVCLPSAHEGGELIVRHAEKKSVYNFAAESNNVNIIQFAAFYGDCEHEVRPVTAGHRVTLTYSILGTPVVKPSYKESHYSSYYWSSTCSNRYYGRAYVTNTKGPHESTTEVLEKIYNKLKSAEECDNMRYLGVFLTHAYTNSALTVSNLKGPDKLLYDMLIDKNVAVSLVPVVSKEKWKFYDHDDDAYELNQGGIPDFPVTLIPGFADLRLPEHKHIPSNIPFVSGWPVDSVRVRDVDTPGGHAGNECDPHSVDKLYIKGAMIIGPVM